MKKIMTLKNLTVFLMFLFYFVIGFSFLILGPNSLFDWKTCLLSLSIVLFLGLIVKYSYSYLFVHNVIMAVFFSLFIIPRLIIYLIIPDMVNFSFGVAISNDQINIALFYMLVGTILISVGFWGGEWVNRRFLALKKPISEPAQYHSGVVLGIFLITVLVGWCIKNILGINFYANYASNNPGAHNYLVQSLLIVFNTDLIFFMTCAALLFRRVFKKNDLLILLFIIAVYLFIQAVNGSRGGGIRVPLMILMIILCLKGDFKVKFWRICIFLTILFSSYFTWPFATQKRINAATEGHILATRGEVVNISSVHPDGSLLYNKPGKLFSAVISRLGVIDNAIIILSINAEPRAKAKYMTMSYAGKNIANLLLPGVLFEDAEINTSRVIPVLYRAFSDDYLNVGGYSSDFYTPWGVFFLVFGWWKGWFMLLVTAMSVHLMYSLVMRFGGKFRYYIGASYLLSVAYLFFANMGIDHWIASSAIILGSGVIAIILFEIGEFILERARLFLKQLSTP